MAPACGRTVTPCVGDRRRPPCAPDASAGGSADAADGACADTTRDAPDERRLATDGTTSIGSRDTVGSGSSIETGTRSSTIGDGARGGSRIITPARAASWGTFATAPLHAQPSRVARSMRTLDFESRVCASSVASSGPPTSIAFRSGSTRRSISVAGSPPGCDRKRLRSGGMTESKTRGWSRRSTPRSVSTASSSSGVSRASTASSAAPGQRPTYVSRIRVGV
jgi:hypothetical protein